MRKVKIAVAVCAVGSALSQSARANIIYLQNFSKNSTGQSPLSSVNWTAYDGNPSTPATLASNGSGGVVAMISGGPSGPTPDGANVNAAQATGNLSNGFAVLLSQDGVQQLVAYTNEFHIDPSAYRQLSFNWSAGTGYSGDTQSLIVQINNGNWYASIPASSPTVIGTSGMAFQNGSTTLSVPLSTSWEALNFAPGSNLTQGSTTPLPGGVITGFGIYAQIADAAGHTDERTFFDTFEVTATAVPEPVSLAVALAAGSLSLRRRRGAR